jgi:hypothetical protein
VHLRRAQRLIRQLLQPRQIVRGRPSSPDRSGKKCLIANRAHRNTRGRAGHNLGSTWSCPPGVPKAAPGIESRSERSGGLKLLPRCSADSVSGPYHGHFSGAPPPQPCYKPRRAAKRSLPSAAPQAGVAELVDALDLGSSDESRGGSNPSARTTPGARGDWRLGRKAHRDVQAATSDRTKTRRNDHTRIRVDKPCR